jgi:hypothetical protein
VLLACLRARGWVQGVGPVGEGEQATWSMRDSAVGVCCGWLCVQCTIAPPPPPLPPDTTTTTHHCRMLAMVGAKDASTEVRLD